MTTQHTTSSLGPASAVDSAPIPRDAPAPNATRTLARAFKEFAQTVLSSVALHATRGWHMLANTLLNLPRLARELGDRARETVATGLR